MGMLSVRDVANTPAVPAADNAACVRSSENLRPRALGMTNTHPSSKGYSASGSGMPDLDETSFRYLRSGRLSAATPHKQQHTLRKISRTAERMRFSRPFGCDLAARKNKCHEVANGLVVAISRLEVGNFCETIHPGPQFLSRPTCLNRNGGWPETLHSTLAVRLTSHSVYGCVNSSVLGRELSLVNNVSPAFTHYIGIDYSGAATPTSSLKGLRIYETDHVTISQEVEPPSSPRKYWTRRGIAEWLVTRLSVGPPTLVGIDHGFSFPLPYFKRHGLPLDWPLFLDDFQRHWPDRRGPHLRRFRSGR